MQVWVVEGQGNVGCVEGDDGREDVSVRVGLHVEDLEEDVERGGGVIDWTGGGGKEVAFGEAGKGRRRLGESAARAKQGQAPKPDEQSRGCNNHGE